MANVDGQFYSGKKGRSGTSPESPSDLEGVQPFPVNPPGSGIGNIPPVSLRYPSDTAMFADQVNQKSGFLYYDGSVTYWYLGTTNGDITDYETFGGGNFVTLDTDQTITGEKKFNANFYTGDTSLDYVVWDNTSKTFGVFSQAQMVHKFRGGASGSLNFGQYDVSGNASINNTSNAKLLIGTNNTTRIEVEADGDVLLKKVDNAIGDFVRIDPTTGQLTKRTVAEVIDEINNNELLVTSQSLALTTAYQLISGSGYSMGSGTTRSKTQFIIEGNYEFTQSLASSRVLSLTFTISGGSTGNSCEVPITLTANNPVNVAFKYTMTWRSSSILDIYGCIVFKDTVTGVVTVNNNFSALGGLSLVTGYTANVSAKISVATGTPILQRHHISFNEIFHSTLTT